MASSQRQLKHAQTGSASQLLAALPGAHHGRLSSACDMRKRRKTSAYPDSFLSECKAVSERRLRLARVGMGSGAKARGGVTVGTSSSRSWEEVLWEEDILDKKWFMAEYFHKSILIHEGPDPLIKPYLCLLRNLGEEQTRRWRVRYDGASI